MPPLLSIVIPVKEDAVALAQLLPALPAGADVEVIVACAVPVDAATAALRTAYRGVRWVESAPGRGPQQNAGAACATGTWLWFLHADSRLPPEWLDVFRNLDAARDEMIGGVFGFALDSPRWQARLLERAVRWRVRCFGLAYGDQGLFVRRDVFEAIGGFAPIPVMEDVELLQRLKRRGRLRHLTHRLTTSARRWEAEGWWRRSAANLVLLALYHLGVSPERLARRYDRRRPERAAGATAIRRKGESDVDQETR